MMIMSLTGCPYNKKVVPHLYVVDDSCLTDLEEVFDPPLTSLLVVAPSFSRTPIATSVSELTLLASPLP